MAVMRCLRRACSHLVLYVQCEVEPLAQIEGGHRGVRRLHRGLEARELLEDTNHRQEQSVLLRDATATASLEQLERVIQNSVEANIKSGEAFDLAIAQVSKPPDAKNVACC